MRIVLIVIIFCSCGINSNKIIDEPIALRREYIESQESQGNKSYVHYLSLSGCQEEYCDFIKVLKFAKGYYDTCKTKTPIGAICLLRNTNNHNFKDHEPDYDAVYKDAIFEIEFNIKAPKTTFPILSFSIFENGKHKELNIEELNSLISIPIDTDK